MATPKSINPKSGIKGMDVVLSNLNREILAIKGRSMAGLIEASVLIRRDMEKTPPLIPIDTGNLRASWFVTQIRKVKQFGLVMGFSSNYAVFVHEMVDRGSRRINWKRPGSGPKFFEAALRRNTKQIFQIIAKNARIKR